MVMGPVKKNGTMGTPHQSQYSQDPSHINVQHFARLMINYLIVTQIVVKGCLASEMVYREPHVGTNNIAIKDGSKA